MDTYGQSTGMTAAQATALIVVAFLVCVTIYAIVRSTQRHYLQMKQIEKEMAEVAAQETLVNGRSTADLVEEAKAAERIARAREKESKALARIAEQKEQQGQGEG